MHMLAGLVSVPGPPLDDPVALMGYDLQADGGRLTWFAVALDALDRRRLHAPVRAGDLGLPAYLPEASACLLGAGGLLTNTFLLSFVYLGAVPGTLRRDRPVGGAARSPRPGAGSCVSLPVLVSRLAARP